MADVKLTAKTALTIPATGDFFHVVDVSDTTADAAGTSKKITYSNISTNLTGTAASLTAGDVANAPVIAKVLTAYSKGAGTVADTDSILEAIQKLDANDDAKAPIASPTFTGTVKGISIPFTFAISDETTAITTGTAKLTWRAPYACTVDDVRASLTTASTSGLPTFDINEGGTTILSTKITIDANEKTSTTAATAPVISDSALADDAEITFDIDVAGTGAAGAKITMYLTRV